MMFIWELLIVKTWHFTFPEPDVFLSISRNTPSLVFTRRTLLPFVIHYIWNKKWHRRCFWKWDRPLSCPWYRPRWWWWWRGQNLPNPVLSTGRCIHTLPPRGTNRNAQASWRTKRAAWHLLWWRHTSAQWLYTWRRQTSHAWQSKRFDIRRKFPKVNFGKLDPIGFSKKGDETKKVSFGPKGGESDICKKGDSGRWNHSPIDLKCSRPKIRRSHRRGG